MLKIALTAFLLFALALTVLPTVARGSTGQKKQKADAAKDLYVANCQMCHGVDGRAPVKEMGFVGRKWKTKTAAEAGKVIAEGVPGTAMLPFDRRLTKEQIAALARYVRSLDTPAARKKK